MSTVQIVRLDNQSKKDLDRFIDIAWKVFPKGGENEKWVPPLRLSVLENIDVKKNPFYKRATIELFVAVKDGKDVGRIAAITNSAHEEFHHEKIGFYGFFESIDDLEVSRALFKAVAETLKAKGYEEFRGPVNPSTNHECGLLVRGQSQHPTIMTTWNPKYYVDHHEQLGLEKDKDTVAYFLATDKKNALPPKVIAYTERLKKSQRLVFRDFDLKNFDRDVEICFEIYNSAWEKNWGFFPMTREEFQFMAKEMKMVLNPKFAFIAEKEGKPAGFMLALPDYNYIFKRITNGKLFPTGIFKLLFGKHLLKTVRIITLG
ncbi:MAG: N-acetyltransferase, partial [Proteobacteria bacterium]